MYCRDKSYAVLGLTEGLILALSEGLTEELIEADNDGLREALGDTDELIEGLSEALKDGLIDGLNEGLSEGLNDADGLTEGLTKAVAVETIPTRYPFCTVIVSVPVLAVSIVIEKPYAFGTPFCSIYKNPDTVAWVSWVVVMVKVKSPITGVLNN